MGFGCPVKLIKMQSTDLATDKVLAMAASDL